MKNGVNTDPARRHFLKQLGWLALAASFWNACRDSARKWAVRFSGTPFSLGHRLLLRDFPKVAREERVKILIVGGGIAGLSACRTLAQNGETDFLLLDMDEQAGGNSSWRQNAYSAYPLGAHYLPMPNSHDSALIRFLTEEGLITGRDEHDRPVYREDSLCAAPQARLFIRQHWQEGLIPQYGVSEVDQANIQAFYREMETFKNQRGADGKYLFDLPLRACSDDPSFSRLDALSMSEWMEQHGFTSPELRAHVQYCCLDDFGVGLERVSAWAGIHYFAARKSPQDNVLTWPEGNGHLVKCLEKYARERIRTRHLAFEVSPEAQEVAVKVYDAVRNESILIRAERLILATPQFVNQRLLSGRELDLNAFHYAPWLVATLILKELPSGSGMPLCWDNVIFEAQGLGYINDQQQSVTQERPRQVITYYYALQGADSKTLRRQLYEKGESYWQQFVLDDLQRAHPSIADWIESMEIQRWGHGMISPVKGFLSGPVLKAARTSVHPRILLAHSDLSGMSLFEEAFHQGLTAAEKCLQSG